MTNVSGGGAGCADTTVALGVARFVAVALGSEVGTKVGGTMGVMVGETGVSLTATTGAVDGGVVGTAVEIADRLVASPLEFRTG
jgi:hypothetical protein